MLGREEIEIKRMFDKSNSVVLAGNKNYNVFADILDGRKHFTLLHSCNT